MISLLRSTEFFVDPMSEMGYEQNRRRCYRNSLVDLVGHCLWESIEV